MTDRPTAPATWDDVVAEAFRVTVDRAARGVASQDECVLLRQHTELLLADLARARQELAGHAAADSADAAAGSYASSAEHAVADPARWLHILFTSPDPTTANTSALAIADHLVAEFPGVSMRISSNATEADTRPVHIGGRANAEDCPACTGTNPPYPFICPGSDEAATECKAEATTLNSTAANASRVEPDGLREQLHAAIESEMYEYRERSMWWPETGGVTEEIARLATRGALEALGLTEPTPPAPRDPCPYCEASSERVPRALMAEHVATVHPEQQR